MNDTMERDRKRKLADKLLRGERVVVNSSGRVETVEEAKRDGEPTMTVPEGVMA